MATTKVTPYELLRFIAPLVGVQSSVEVRDRVMAAFSIKERSAKDNLSILVRQGYLMAATRCADGIYRYSLTEAGRAVVDESNMLKRVRISGQMDRSRTTYSTCSTKRPFGERPEVGRIVRRGSMPILTPEWQQLYAEGKVAFCPTCSLSMHGSAPDGMDLNVGVNICAHGHPGDILVAPGWEAGYCETLLLRKKEAEAAARAARPKEFCGCGLEVNEDNPPWPDGECTTCGNARFRREHEEEMREWRRQQEEEEREVRQRREAERERREAERERVRAWQRTFERQEKIAREAADAGWLASVEALLVPPPPVQRSTRRVRTPRPIAPVEFVSVEPTHGPRSMRRPVVRPEIDRDAPRSTRRPSASVTP